MPSTGVLQLKAAGLRRDAAALVRQAEEAEVRALSLVRGRLEADPGACAAAGRGGEKGSLEGPAAAGAAMLRRPSVFLDPEVSSRPAAQPPPLTTSNHHTYLYAQAAR